MALQDLGQFRLLLAAQRPSSEHNCYPHGRMGTQRATRVRRLPPYLSSGLEGLDESLKISSHCEVLKDFLASCSDDSQVKEDRLSRVLWRERGFLGDAEQGVRAKS